MLEKLDAIEKRFAELNELMAQPEVASDFDRLQELAREQSSIEDLVNKYGEYKASVSGIRETEIMLDGDLDDEMAPRPQQFASKAQSGFC